MTRRMSCSMTVNAVRDRTKTVTRRHWRTWRFLVEGDRLTLIEKGMGLPKGAKQIVLADVEIVNVGIERLGQVELAECVREGFPEMSPLDFKIMWARSHGYTNAATHGPLDDILCRRIEWRYLGQPQMSTQIVKDIAALATEFSPWSFTEHETGT